jgi:hypothetical protein
LSDAAPDTVERGAASPLAHPLHAVLIEGTPTLPPEELHDLVDATGRLRHGQWRGSGSTLRAAGSLRTA